MFEWFTRLPRAFAWALLLLTTAVAPAHATVIIDDNPGGIIEDFVSSYRELAKQGDKVIIRGDCVSACSLITALVPAGRVCATPYATLGFHSASVRTEAGTVYSKKDTEAVWKMYPAKVRKIVAAHGWDGGEHPKVVYIRATEFYKPCASGHYLNDATGVSMNFQAPWFGPEVAPEAVPLPTPKAPVPHVAPKRPAVAVPHKPVVPAAVPVVKPPKPKAPVVAPVKPAQPVGTSWLWSLLQNLASIVIVGAAVAVIVRYVRHVRSSKAVV